MKMSHTTYTILKREIEKVRDDAYTWIDTQYPGKTPGQALRAHMESQGATKKKAAWWVFNCVYQPRSGQLTNMFARENLTDANIETALLRIYKEL